MCVSIRNTEEHIENRLITRMGNQNQYFLSFFYSKGKILIKTYLNITSQTLHEEKYENILIFK